MKVQWKLEGYFKADATKCFKEIGNKDVTPEKVLEKAKDEKSELHKCFEWNDGIAANKYRLLQAEKIIRMLVTVPEREDETPKRVLQISSETRVYQPMTFFMRNEDEASALLKRAKEELMAFQNRYESLRGELEEVFDAIEKIIA